MPRMNRCSILVAALLCTAAAGAQEVPASGILLDSYAAVVNGKVVTVGDVLAAMQPAQERLLTEYTGRDLEQHMLAQFNSTRSNLGAVQNRLGYAAANLQTSVENLTAAESVVRDVDMASEMTDFTKNQILMQAGTSMLAQANQTPQQLLALLGR